jgi:peroxiredoxin
MIVILFSLIALSVWVGFYQLVKQQGRILLRLDALELAVRTGRHVNERRGDGVYDGLAAGTVFPDFEFRDLSGKTRSLAQLKGKGLLLIYWNFECEFCEAIAGDLAELETHLEQQNAKMVLLASGDESFNREGIVRHRLKASLLLLNGKRPPEPFERQGTPVAYFLNARGQVAAPFASGADEVLALARRISSSPESIKSNDERRRLNTERSLADSLIMRNGLSVGTRAPNFCLADLQGETVSLDDYHGRRVLLVFSDPKCGPCDELAPHLSRLHQPLASNGVAMILVGRGSADENRNKAAEFGFQFPVVLQNNWKLSKEYGIFATPVAFLIAENGLIARDVAIGKNAILDLAAEAKTEHSGEYHEFSTR